MQIREHDKLGPAEEHYARVVKSHSVLGFGRMIQIAQYIWTDHLMETGMYKHLNDKEKELAASKRGSSETNWILNSLNKADKEIDKQKIYITKVQDKHDELLVKNKSLEIQTQLLRSDNALLRGFIEHISEIDCNRYGDVWEYLEEWNREEKL